MLGLPGNGRRITFRVLHVFEFRGGLISRENVWLDGAAIQQQLACPAAARRQRCGDHVVYFYPGTVRLG